MTDRVVLRVFVASPGDTEDQRIMIADAMNRINLQSESSERSDYRFQFVGWEQVRGTVGRPQEKINELINECHYMMTLFKGRWGSDPGIFGNAFSSGTEEELFTAFLALGRAEMPMRDVWVCFLPSQEKDPRIDCLQEKFREEAALLYDSPPDMRTFVAQVEERLLDWIASFSTKRSNFVTMKPLSGHDVLGISRKVIQGQQLIALGHPDEGTQLLKDAAAAGGPEEHLILARRFRHLGDLVAAEQEALAALRVVTDHPEALLSSSLAADCYGSLASILRARGKNDDAIGRLASALNTLGPGSPETWRSRSLLLDNLGLCEKARGNNAQARSAYEEALNLRKMYGGEFDTAQAHINLARLSVAEDDLKAAHGHAVRANECLSGATASDLHANAYTLLAQVLLRLDRPEEALGKARAGLAMNDQLGILRGAAISHLLCAQCSSALGDFEAAIDSAERSLDQNLSLGNRYGEARCRNLLAKLRAEIP